MAERRMFAKTIVLSDAFLDMPLSARCLYFTLGMFADDDGFVGSPKGIMRQCGASQDDLILLIQKRFVLAFETGVIVIKHWRINNYLQNDRHKDTAYIEELAKLDIDKNGAYTEKEPMYTDCIQNVYTGKNSIDKDSIVKDSIDNSILADSDSEIFIKLPLNDKTEYEVSFKDVSDYQELYPAVDVKQQFRNMKGWCDANPANRKTKSGIKRFINSWLSKEQNRGGNYKPEMPQEKTSGKNYNANKGLMTSYTPEFFETLERETKNRAYKQTEPIIEKPKEEKPKSKLTAKMLSLPINEDFHFEYQGKEFWGTRFANSVGIMLKNGELEQYSIEKLEEHINELPDYKRTE